MKTLEECKKLPIEEMKTMLKPREERFCREFLKDFNGTRAAIRAGYSEKSAASQSSRMLKRPAVVAYRDALIQQEADAVGISKGTLLLETWELYKRCTAKVPVLEWDRASKTYVPTGEWTFNAKSALRALAQLERLIGTVDDDDDDWLPEESGGGERAF